MYSSVELTTELEALSGWPRDGEYGYSLGLLLSKLPKKFVRKKVTWGFVMTSSTSDGSWVADYYSGGWHYFDDDRSRDNWLHNGDRAILTEANTPEDAACKLAIELFKQGVLHPQDKGSDT